ncbi:MAG: ABC transporter permease, partial [Verrucomicrobiota bacterium]
MPWPAYIALKQLFPSGRSFSFYAIISILGVTLGVGVMIVFQAVMNGYSEELKASIVDYQGSIRIRSNGIIYNSDSLLKTVMADPAVAGATPYAEGLVLLQHRNIPVFPAIRGIDVQRETSVIPLDQHLIYGDVADLDDRSVFIGQSLAAQVGAEPGDFVEV